MITRDSVRHINVLRPFRTFEAHEEFSQLNMFTERYQPRNGEFPQFLCISLFRSDISADLQLSMADMPMSGIVYSSAAELVHNFLLSLFFGCG